MSARTARLVRPSLAYRDGYIAAIREHQLDGRYLDRRYVGADVAQLERDFASFVRDLLEREQPSLWLGRVAETFYWFVDADEYVGQASFRDFRPDDPGLREVGHIGYDIRPSRQGQGYGTAILGAMLVEMRPRGVSSVYVNCDEDNPRSRRVIERWGGTFRESIVIPGRSVRRRRYRIDIA
ncbi:MAG: GNAT family N-acetyltransferase [Candidatus Eremiobacteraeota bacterium]|nr:GNAT family N-acetyltransferase [Candidatus Eremiobacteraeota bacterium]MBV9647234.1 GNAT family N-acetyltransferase [Candidatus Eremiobacteraeota bacterium]